MSEFRSELDEAAILKHFDRSSPDALLRSIAGEFLRLRQANAALAARVAAMETLQACVDRMVASGAEVAVAYPLSYRLEAADSGFDAIGFYPLEHDEQRGAYRWTGPNRHFSFQFFIDRRRSQRFVLTFAAVFAKTSLEKLLCFVDGEPEPITVESGAEGFAAKGVMRPRKDRGGSVLTFIVPQIGRPSGLGVPDDRQLGLAFQRLTVETASESGTPAGGGADFGRRAGTPF